MPLSNEHFYDAFRYNNYDFENLFKAYRSLGDDIIKNFRQTEKNLFVTDIGTYRIIPRQYVNIGGAQYDINVIKSNLKESDIQKLENRISHTIPPIKEQKYYNTWDIIPSDISMFEFTTNGDRTCHISGCNNGSVSDIVIPYQDSEGNIVTGISGAFSGNSVIRNVVIPSSILWIDDESFKNCVNLKTVSISYGIQLVGKSAFENCASLIEVDFPNSILEIRDRAFKNCISLKTISLSESLVELGVEAFAGCVSLNNVKLPDALVLISDYAFMGCKSIESINTPLVTSIIGAGTFKNCSALKDIGLHENLSEIREEAFSGCASVTGVFIPKNVKILGDSVFMDCKLLSNITFEDSETPLTVGDRAFASCAFETIVLPNRINSIGDYALYDNKALTNIKYPANEALTYVPQGMFLDCKSLVQVCFSEYVTYVNRLAFSGCITIESMCFKTNTELRCFDVSKCKERAKENLEFILGTSDDSESILNNIFSDNEINFGELEISLTNDGTKTIAQVVLSTIEEDLPFDKELFSSACNLSNVYTNLSDESANDIKSYYDFISEYDSNYNKIVSFETIPDDFEDNFEEPDPIEEKPSETYVKQVLTVYTEVYPLSENAYDYSAIMSNNELCALLDTHGYYIEFMASMNYELVDEKAHIIGFELYDESGKILVEGSDYMFLNNKLYLLDEYANKTIHSPDNAFELRNIAIDFKTLENKIGNNLEIKDMGVLSRTEFCDAIKQYTLHCLLGPKLSAFSSAAYSNDKTYGMIEVYDYIHSTPDIKEFMEKNNLTPYDFVISAYEDIDSRRLRLFAEYARAIKPPETNFVILCTGIHEETLGEITDTLGGELEDFFEEDYAQKITVGEVLNLNKASEVTNTLSYVTYHKGQPMRSERIKDELTSYEETSSDILYVKKDGEWVVLKVINDGQEQDLKITD